MKPILEVKNVSKRFRIYHEVLPYETLGHKLTHPHHLFRRRKSEEFWALRNVSFDVQQGQSVGIIGKNGAGKSTLLKILSRITGPSDGRIVSRGRIASLLEVGTGFHPELTGRENIFLNGSILGMRRKEIQKHFDEIIDFAGIEKFLDTALKHYSSGMQLRLAFAVAAFLEPEIMIIDEVLAVGDADFQKKCIQKMEGVTRSGRTILFVSHQMGLVKQLCDRAILLQQGGIVMDGTTESVTNRYLTLNQGESDNRFVHPKPSGPFYIAEAETVDAEGVSKSSFGHNEMIRLAMSIRSENPLNDELISVALLDKYGSRVFTVHQPLSSFPVSENIRKGTLEIPSGLIAPNLYGFHFAVVRPDGKVYDIHEGQCKIKVIDTGTPFSMYEGKDYGNIIIRCDWKF